MKSRRPNPQAGFAVLFIASMAAVVAILLFMAIPRVAFEAQRDKEQLLIDRGEQYSRAIQLYVRKFNRFPPDFDALDNTQNLRFLRQHYKDPMTGKDDWRIIHVGPGGVFTDSLVYNKKKDDGSQPKEQQTFITEMQQTGGNPVDPNQNINVGTRQRQSDQPGAPGDPNNPTAPQPPQFDANGYPIQQPTQVLPNGQTAPFNPQTGQQGFNPNGTPMAPGQPFPNQGLPNQGLPNQGFPNQPYPVQGFQNNQNNPPPYVGGFGQQQPGNQQQSGAPPVGASGLINQLLTTPRPGGLNGLGGQTAGSPDPGSPGGAGANSLAGGTGGTPLAPMGGQAIGGGIGGIASKLEETGIKVYKDQKSYNKWEFVYDITKDPARAGATAVPAAGAPQPQNGQNPNGAAPNAGPTGSSGAGFGFGGLTGTTTTNTPPATPMPPPGVTPQQ